MIFLILRWFYLRGYNPSKDRDLNLRMTIAMELLFEMLLVLSAILLNMGLA